MNPGVLVRVIATRAVGDVLQGQRSLKSVLQTHLESIPDGRDRALLEAICFNALRHHQYYEYVLSQWMKKPLAKRDFPAHCLLLCGLAQLHAMQLHAHAAVSASVDAARELGQESQANLVNAILRRASREALPQGDSIAVKTSHPEWLVKQLMQDWPNQAHQILSANNEMAPLWIRINSTRSSRTELLTAMREAAIECEAPSFPSKSICITQSQAMSQLPGWASGKFTVQDGAAQLAVEALAVQEHENILDACAAPGGKTAQMAESIYSGKILALDVAPNRIRLINDTLDRLELNSHQMTVKVGDAADPFGWWDGELFDAILLDAPCSATGIIRRQPDIKWHRRPDDITRLSLLQNRLLTALWGTLKPGGRLLYCTCSVLKAENEARIYQFLSEHSDAKILPLGEHYGLDRGVGRQRFPGQDGMDGFFYALLQKAESAA
jgi:16S rRNA (cytosine967-C5)-methyltransferase